MATRDFCVDLGTGSALFSAVVGKVSKFQHGFIFAFWVLPGGPICPACVTSKGSPL